MHPFKAIGLKLISALLFAAMSALVRQLGDVAPVGQMVFFRSAFAIVPVVVIYAIRGELGHGGANGPAIRPARPRDAQRLRHVHQLFGAHTAAARRRDRDFVCVAADHRGACRCRL